MGSGFGNLECETLGIKRRRGTQDRIGEDLEISARPGIHSLIPGGFIYKLPIRFC